MNIRKMLENIQKKLRKGMQLTEKEDFLRCAFDACLKELHRDKNMGVQNGNYEFWYAGNTYKLSLLI
jgi:hypothetical protein